MTEAPTGATVQELARAASALRSAEILERSGELADAVSRAYYAIFHAACALLASIGCSFRTHDDVRRLVSEHFVKTGLLDAKFSRALTHAAADRNDADYDVSSVFTAGDVQRDIELARDFLAADREIVAASPGEPQAG